MQWWRERTVVVQMVSDFHVTMPSGRDMKVSLHLISFQTAIDPAASAFTSPHPWRLFEFPLSLFYFSYHVARMRITLHLFLCLIPRASTKLQAPPQPAVSGKPMPPVCRIPCQHVAREDAITARILNIDM